MWCRLARGLEALQRHRASEPELPHLVLSQKGGTKASSSPKGALGLQNKSMLGHVDIFSNVTAAIEPPMILDLQGQIFVTFGLERLLPGLDGCISFYWCNLIIACRFLFIFLKAPTTSAVALMKIIFPKTIKH